MHFLRPLKGKTIAPFLLFGAVATLTALLVIGVASWLFYRQTASILEANLRQRLLAIVTTSAAQFDPHDIEQLQVEQDWTKPAWAKVVNQMRKIRENNADILFAYMFRKSDSDPTKMKFIADSHSINPYVNVDGDPANDLDLDGNGKIDDADQLQWPGQPYPTAPTGAFEAYNGPTTNKDMYEDQWGKVLTGYVPLKDESGRVTAIFAVDIRANDFDAITRQTLIPFAVYSGILAVIIVALSSSLVQIGRSRIALLQEIDEQKNRVISTVAHQLNTPITTVKWAVELLRDGSYSPEESATQIEQGVEQLKSLADMFLQASHIQKGKLDVVKAPVNLSDFFASLVSEISILARKKNVHFVPLVPASLPTAVLDAKYTRVTIENLLTNAVKYTPENGRVDLIVEIKGQTLHCTVKDTGLGIPKKDQDKIFGQMYRASNVSKPKAEGGIEGNGLGLYAAKGAIEAQGGKIWFESEEGKGTTFFVELPLNAPAAGR